MPNNEDGVNTLWLIVVTIGGIFGVLNIIKWFKHPEKSTAEEYENIIAQKDQIIETLEKRIIQYQKIIENDNKIRTRNNME